MLESNLQNADNRWTSFIHRDEISISTLCSLKFAKDINRVHVLYVSTYVCTNTEPSMHRMQRINRAKKRSIKIHKLSLRVCSRINRFPLCHHGLAVALPNINEKSTPEIYPRSSLCASTTWLHVHSQLSISTKSSGNVLLFNCVLILY